MSLFKVLAALFRPTPSKSAKAQPSARRLRDDGSPWCDFEIVGESFYQENLLAIAGGYSRDGHRTQCIATLLFDAENPHDENAVRVEIDGKTVGYLSASHALRYRKVLAKFDRPGPLQCEAIIVGGSKSNQHNQTHFGVKLERPWPLKKSPAPPASPRR